MVSHTPLSPLPTVPLLTLPQFTQSEWALCPAETLTEAAVPAATDPAPLPFGRFKQEDSPQLSAAVCYTPKPHNLT